MAMTIDTNVNFTPTNTSDTGTQNDYNPSGWSGVACLVAISGTLNLTGMAASNVGRLMAFALSNAITTTVEDAGSSATTRFASDCDCTGTAKAARLMWYDPTSQRWRAVM